MIFLMGKQNLKNKISYTKNTLYKTEENPGNNKMNMDAGKIFSE